MTTTAKTNRPGLVQKAGIFFFWSILLLFCTQSFSQTNKGQDFWLAETPNLVSGNFAISVANPGTVAVNIVITNPIRATVSATIAPGALQTFQFTTEGSGIVNTGTYTNNVYHITATKDVVVYDFTPLANAASNDAALILPTNSLGKKYRPGSFVNSLGNSQGSFFGVLATQNGTNVKTYNRTGVLVDNVTINQGQYFQRNNGNTVATDITGWYIKTDKPAAVFSGNVCTSAGNSTGACDHIDEQVLPLESMASAYVAAPSNTRPIGCTTCSPDIFRYVATEDGTVITTSPNVGGGTINKGQFIEISTNIPHIVSSNSKPFYGYQYLISANSGSPVAGTGDPSLLGMPPVDQFQFDYIFLVPNTFAYNFINVVAPTGTNFTLDGAPLAASCTVVGTLNSITYCTFHVSVPAGSHKIFADKQFGLSISGFDNFASYAYLGGVGLQPINAGCNTGGPYQRTTCSLAPIQLNGVGTCSDGSTPSSVLWTSSDGVVFSNPNIANPTATVPGYGTFNICFTVTCAGVSVQCCSQITVNAPVGGCNTAPVAVCQPVTISANSNCQGVVAASAFNGGSTDADGDVLTYSVLPAGPYSLGTTNVTLTVTDSKGATSTCTTTVRVIDNTKPTIVCPPNQTLPLDASCNATLPDYRSLLSVSDNCTATGTLLIVQSPAAGTLVNSKGALIVTFTVTDAAGNFETCNITVDKKDVTAPVINCPAPISVPNDINVCGARVTFALPTATDNCSGSAFNFFNAGEPNNSGGEDYLQLYTSGTWNDLPPGNSNQFIIELNTINTTPITNFSLIGTFGGHTYFISTYSTSWPSARTAALAISGADLASINTLAEDNFLAPYGGNTWVGGYQDHSDPSYAEPGNASQNFGGWKWVDGTKLGAGQITITQTAGFPSGTVFPIGTTVNTFRATDESGNSSFCSFNVTVTDTQDPVINCGGTITHTADAGVCSYSFIPTAPVATDNCPGVIVSGVRSDAQSLTAPYPVGTTTITWTAKDASNRIKTCTQNIVVTDNENPVITCAGAITHTADAGLCSYSFTPTAPAATDNCPGVTVSGTRSDAQSLTAPYPVGTTTITWKATDAHNNIKTCTQTVTVTDDENPVITCAAAITHTADAGLCSYSFTPSAPAATDNCPGVTVTGSRSDAQSLTAPYPVGTTTITWRATDAHAHSVTCTQTVTVTDDENPVITCTAPITHTADAGLCSYSFTPTAPAATDNCPGVTVSGTRSDAQSLTAPYPVGTTTITWTATDAHAHSVTCTQTVTVTDNEKPVITCGAAITHTSDAGVCTYSFTPTAPAATDNCPGVTVAGVRSDAQPLNAPYPFGTTTITWTATDAHSNTSSCTQVVNVTDVEKPVIHNLPASFTIDALNANCSNMVLWTKPTASDNCGIASFSSNNPFFDIAGVTILSVGVNTITYTATDIHGNTTTASFTITVVDNQPPILTGCPANITVNAATGTCEKTVGWNPPTASDNCPGVSLTTNHIPGESFSVGTTTVTYTATDHAGLVTICSFTVTVIDNQLPVITCPAPVSTSNDAGRCGATVTIVAATATDNCPGVTVAGVRNDAQALNALYPVGTTTITWTATDAHSNTATCTQTITVRDTENPVITCGAPITHTANTGVCSYSFTPTAPVATDNCPGVTVAGVRNDGQPLSAAYPVGTTTITWTATDAYAHSVTCTQTVTITDDENPVINCASNISHTADAGVCSYSFIPATPAATDNCPGVTVTGTRSDARPLNTPYPSGVTTITWTATDAHGHTIACTQTVTVTDNERPTIVCAPAQTVNLDANCAGTLPDFRSLLTVNDNCTPTGSLVITQSPAAGTALNGTGNITVTFTVVDAAGNNTTCSITVTKKDVTPPVITCPQPITVNNDVNKCGAIVNYGAIQSSLFASSSTGTNAGSLFSVNITTGVATLIGPNGLGIGSNRLTSLAKDPVSGDLYGVIGGSAQLGGYLIKLNPATGAGTLVGMMSGSGFNGAPGAGGADALAFSASGLLYSSGWSGGFPGGSFLRVNKTNGSVILASSTTSSAEYTGLAFSPSTGVLWASRGGNSPGRIHTVDPNTGFILSTLNLSDGSARVTDLAFSPSGILYGSIGGNSNNLAIINTATGAITTVGNFGPAVQNIAGLTFVSSSSGPIQATDNCGTVTVTQTGGLPSGSLFPVGVTTNTFVATDASGNTSTCSFNVTVNDTQFPVLVNVPANTTAECDAVPTAANVTATDNCSTSIPSYTETRTNGNCPGNYTLTRTWSTTDASGNTTTATQTIVVRDTKAPVLSAAPANTTVECDAVPAAVVLTATDRCDAAPVVTYAEVRTNGNCPSNYSLTRTWTATDACGNFSTATQVITVRDTKAPVLSAAPADVTVECDAVPAAVVLTAIDNCDMAPGVTYAEVRTNGNCPSNYILTRTWTATDACGNISSATQVITVQDTKAPVLSAAPADVTVECDAVPVAVVLTAIDNCDMAPGVTYAEVRTNGNCPSNYILTRTWTATDACGNISSATQVITVQDTKAPVLSVTPADVTVECDAVPVAAILTAIDNCDMAPVVTYAEVRTNGTCANTYILTRTWTATDACGNRSSSTQVITVQDTQAPVTSAAPADVTVECNAVPVAAVLTASDNCEIPTVVYAEVRTNGVCANTYILTRTWTSTDGCGNTSSKTQVITVQDTQAPVISDAPADVTVECDAVPAAAILTATDNCETPTVVYAEVRTNGVCANTYILTRTWTSTDGCGNTSSKTQVITVQDTQAPVISDAPADVTVECNAVPVAAILTATDNCEIPTVVYAEVRTNGVCANTYILTRTWTSTDGCGNTSSKTQVITVQDTQAPVISAAPADITVECNAVPVAAVLTATDNCETPTVVYAEVRTNGTCANTYILTRTWTSTDGCGNTSSKTQMITVQDTQAPVISAAPANVTVECDAVPAAAILTATDNCETPTVVYTEVRTNGACANTYILTRTWTSTDGCGNTSSKTQVITVQDTQAPVISAAPANVTVECDAVPAAAVLTATDNCETPTVVYTEVRTNGNCPGNYILTRTWTSTDGCGNTSSKKQVITVQDTKKPVLSAAPANVTVECNAVPAAAILTATDNCSTPVVTYTEVRTNGTSPGNYTLTRTWTATDACGNTCFKTQTIIVRDTQAPVPTIAALPTLTGDCSVTATVPTATDNCAGTITATTLNPVSYTAQGVFTITWSYSDGNGNTSTQTQRVVVKDVTPPVPTVATLPTVTGQCTATVTTKPTATDVCSGITAAGTTTDPLSYSVQGTYTIHWTYTDSYGNKSYQNQTVIVKDNIAPVPVVATLPTATGQCSAGVVIIPSCGDNCNCCRDNCRCHGNDCNCRSGSYSSYSSSLYNWWNQWYGDDDDDHGCDHDDDDHSNGSNYVYIKVPTATDNCKGTITGTTTDPLTYSTQGTYIIHWKFDDGNGNISIQQQTVIVHDNVAPVANNSNLSTVYGTCSVTVTNRPTAKDNCKGTITGTTTDPLTYTGNGTYTIHWTYNDGNGNTSTQNQTVIIADNTKPVISEQMISLSIADHPHFLQQQVMQQQPIIAEHR